MKTLFVSLYWRARKSVWKLQEIIGKFVGLRAHIHIKREFPKPSGTCGFCGEPFDRIVAINTGDGWEIDFGCSNYCGEGEPIVGWWPFWFGAWANENDFESAGIEVV